MGITYIENITVKPFNSLRLIMEGMKNFTDFIIKLRWAWIIWYLLWSLTEKWDIKDKII